MQEIQGELKFPVVAHHRLIVKAEAKDLKSLQNLFASFDLVEPITESNTSSSGKYVSFNLSVRLASRDEMNRLDAQLKLIPGLKLVV